MMNIRLSIDDQAYVRALQEHFAGMEPIGVELGNTDVVRLALRTTISKAKIAPSELNVAREDLLAQEAAA